MNGTGVIDRFLDVFTRYIDSGFGLLGGEVAFLAATLIVIDITLAALFWALGADDDIIARLIKKTLFVGVFAWIIGNWNFLAQVIFDSFAGLGLVASGSTITAQQLLQPGRVAQVGLDAGRPLLQAVSGLMGYISFFTNFVQIAILMFACAFRPPEISYDDEPIQATQIPEPPRPVEIVEVPTPLPLPGQLQRIPPSRRTPEPPDPTVRVNQANTAARVQPVRAGFINAVQVYPFTPGALYQVYTAPGQVTAIMLQEGETLVGNGPVAAGDTVRWIIGDTESGTGPTRRVHIIIKPTRPDLTTNLIINTDRRTYLLELRSTERTYMASVSWQYPQDALIALRRQNAAAPVEQGLDLARLRFRYDIEGDSPAWRPLRAFDDGRQVFIEFPRGIGQGEMPPLFVIGPEGEGQLVNYRVRQNFMIVDRLFAAAELRLGDRQQRVRIVRTDGRAR